MSGFAQARAMRRRKPTAQHALLVVARSHEFLGDEVHAVMQAGHDAQIRSAKKLEDFVRLVMADEKHDRAIARRADAAR